METRVILFNPFGYRENEKPSMLDVINFGKFDGEKLHYITRDGEQIRPLSKIEDTNRTKVVSIEEIDFRKSFGWWFKEYPKEINKEIILDTTLSEGLEYKGNCWHFGLFIKVTKENIYVNPNLTL